MPEIITKYPDLVIKVLEGAGVKCGVGQKQQILKACPPAQFCSTPTGELCVYGINDISKMTQITQADVSNLVKPVPVIYGWHHISLLAVIFVLGLLFGIVLQKKRQRRRY